MKHTIWSSLINWEDWNQDKEELCEDVGIDPANTEAFEDYVYETNDMYFQDEKDNLNIDVPEGLVIFGDCGRWNGRATGIVSIDENNIGNCLKYYNDYWLDASFEVDEDFIITGYHHDGTDYYTVRKWKSNEAREKAIELLDNGTAPKDIYDEYTESVANLIGSVYGWE